MGEIYPWDRVLELVNQDLVERRSKKLFVEIHSEAGSCRKEIGDLSGGAS